MRIPNRKQSGATYLILGFFLTEWAALRARSTKDYPFGLEESLIVTKA